MRAVELLRASSLDTVLIESSQSILTSSGSKAEQAKFRWWQHWPERISRMAKSHLPASVIGILRVQQDSHHAELAKQLRLPTWAIEDVSMCMPLQETMLAALEADRGTDGSVVPQSRVGIG